MTFVTRDNQELNSLRDFADLNDLTSLKDILVAGIHIKETSLTEVRKISIWSICQELADNLISIYKKTNHEFIPGQNMMSRKTIIDKIERDWKRAVDFVNSEVKSVKQKRENIQDKLDKIYSVLSCQ